MGLMARMFCSYGRADRQHVEPLPTARAGSETRAANPPSLLHPPRA